MEGRENGKERSEIHDLGHWLPGSVKVGAAQLSYIVAQLNPLSAMRMVTFQNILWPKDRQTTIEFIFPYATFLESSLATYHVWGILGRLLTDKTSSVQHGWKWKQLLSLMFVNVIILSKWCIIVPPMDVTEREREREIQLGQGERYVSGTWREYASWTYMTSTEYLDFWNPLPSLWTFGTDLQFILTKPPFLHLLLGYPPPTHFESHMWMSHWKYFHAKI